MLLILLGVVAAAIIGAGVGSRNTPLNRPPLDYEINVARMNGGIAPESVQMFPNEYFKYRHIVHQAYDYSCGSAALTTVLQFHLGLAVDGRSATPPLTPGHHLLTDPDGRTVEAHAF